MSRNSTRRGGGGPHVPLLVFGTVLEHHGRCVDRKNQIVLARRGSRGEGDREGLRRCARWKG